MMKVIYIFLGIAVLAGLYLTFMGGESTEPVPTGTDAEMEGMEGETASTEVDSSMEDSMDDGASLETEASAEMDTEISGNNDLGMELPTIDDAVGEVKEFTLDAFSYGYSMEEIRVNEGDTVVITLTNSGGFHDWVVDEFGAATEKIQAGDTATVTFVADASGTYEYYCSVGSHRAQGMVGTLIVE